MQAWQQTCGLPTLPWDATAHSGELVWSWLTCTGIPGLNEPPDNGITFITGLFDTIALLLVGSSSSGSWKEVWGVVLGAGLHMRTSACFFQAPFVVEL